MKLDSDNRNLLRRIIPPLVGIVLILAFVRLGFWQLDRAKQKVALQQAFDSPQLYAQVNEDLRPEPFQAIQTRGQYLGNRQVVIENAIQNGALGYYVISPFEFSDYEPLLLINRGWVRRVSVTSELPDIVIDDESRLVRGKSGGLPRVGIRPGEAFADRSQWPRVGVWPTADEIAAELGREVLPYVLLLDADQEYGFSRQWKPPQSGVSTNYGYAFQWFAMAVALFGLMIWNLKKRATERDS